MSAARVTVEGVSVDFGGTRALEGVSLEPEPGHIHALLGPSGCGKTTLLRVLAGLVTPSGGKVRLDGADVTHLPTDRRGVVLVYQEHLLFPQMSVLGNVCFPARARGEPREAAEREARAALARVRLERHERRLSHELSGGERQRVALARALAARPRVLLLDEPLSALDATLRDEMRELIVELQAAAGLTTVVVTHDQREAASLAHRISVMSSGRVLQSDTPARLYQAPASEGVARFLGATNFLDAHLDGATAQTALGSLAVSPPGALGAARLCIWPQDVALGPGPNAVDAVVQHLVFNGAEQRARVGAAGVALELVVPRWTALRVGERLTLHLPPERLIVLPR